MKILQIYNFHYISTDATVFRSVREMTGKTIMEDRKKAAFKRRHVTKFCFKKLYEADSPYKNY